jgi:hypothetical protein
MEVPLKPEKAREAHAHASRFLHDQIVRSGAKQVKYIRYYKVMRCRILAK